MKAYARKPWIIVSIIAVVLLAAGVTAWAATAKIVIEAEHYYSIQASMVVAPSQVASGGKYIQIPLRRPHGESESGPSDTGNALYQIYFPVTGRYNLWGLCHWHDGCGNSFFVFLDADQTPNIMGEDGTYQAWHWVKSKTFNVTQGWHWLRIQNREDGSKLDQFLLTNDLRYTPVRQERETSQYNNNKSGM